MLRRSSRAKRTADPVDERLRALVDEHATAIYRVALGVVRDPSLAEDVVQETVIRAWRALPSYNGTGSMRSWILSIAHNTAVSTLRRIKDEAVSPEDLPEQTAPDDIEIQAEGRHQMDRLRSALAQLDELSRSIVVLRDLEGLSYQQIAEALGVPVPTVKTRLLRARRELQRVVESGDRV